MSAMNLMQKFGVIGKVADLHVERATDHFTNQSTIAATAESFDWRRHGMVEFPFVMIVTKIPNRVALVHKLVSFFGAWKTETPCAEVARAKPTITFRRVAFVTSQESVFFSLVKAGFARAVIQVLAQQSVRSVVV